MSNPTKIGSVQLHLPLNTTAQRGVFVQDALHCTAMSHTHGVCHLINSSAHDPGAEGLQGFST